MSANSVLPPLEGMLRAWRSEYFAGITLNELSECQRRLAVAESRRRASPADTLFFFSGVGTSAKLVGGGDSSGGGGRVPVAGPVSPPPAVEGRVRSLCS